MLGYRNSSEKNNYASDVKLLESHGNDDDSYNLDVSIGCNDGDDVSAGCDDRDYVSAGCDDRDDIGVGNDSDASEGI